MNHVMLLHIVIQEPVLERGNVAAVGTAPPEGAQIQHFFLVFGIEADIKAFKHGKLEHPVTTAAFDIFRNNSGHKPKLLSVAWEMNDFGNWAGDRDFLLPRTVRCKVVKRSSLCHGFLPADAVLFVVWFGFLYLML